MTARITLKGREAWTRPPRTAGMIARRDGPLLPMEQEGWLRRVFRIGGEQ
jgi:hypothetical protein